MSGLFEKPKDKRLARIISIKTPEKFRQSIKTLKEGGLSTKEFKALKLAQTRARLQLRRKNLSAKERMEFLRISRMRIK